MRNRWVAVSLIVSAVFLSGCAGNTKVNSYLLPGGAVGGDASRDLRAVKSIVVWPLENAASGSKAKGVEVKFTDGMDVGLSVIRSSPHCRDVQVEDRFPKGFFYKEGTSRIDDIEVADPQPSGERTYSWPIGDLAPVLLA